MGEIAATPITYGGVVFRSALEADWACTLDHHGIIWQYEPRLLKLPSGALYLPDFWLPGLHTFIEVKGPQMERVGKANELASVADLETVITLIGFPPLMRRTGEFFHDPYMQWRDPLRYDTRFAQCPHCSAWQWLRPQLSRRCRVCGELHQGLLAKGGEIPFLTARPERFRRRPLSALPPLGTWTAAS